MSDDQTKPQRKLDLFHLAERYPDIGKIWGAPVSTIETIKDGAIFVLDTNILLLPYKTSKESLDEIKELYSKLIHEERLFVPEQALREFVNNRSKLLEGMYSSLSKTLENTTQLELKGYPLIKSLGKYDELKELQTSINTQLNEYKTAVKSILEEIVSWQLEDPVSQMYKDLFSDQVIVACEMENEKIEEDFRRRISNEIPPGYKDAQVKRDSGIGDVVIWLTILSLGRKHKKPLIFITGEKKEDWWQLFMKQGIAPRIELVNEYSLNADGQAFCISDLAELLRVFEASKETIKEIRSEEARASRELEIISREKQSLRHRTDLASFAAEAYKFCLGNIKEKLAREFETNLGFFVMNLEDEYVDDVVVRRVKITHNYITNYGPFHAVVEVYADVDFTANVTYDFDKDDGPEEVTVHSESSVSAEVKLSFDARGNIDSAMVDGVAINERDIEFTLDD